MTRLFRRSVRVTVGTVRFSELDVVFRIEKSLKREPNTCDLSIWNLNGDHRRELERQERVPVRVEAGYGDTLEEIFSGDLRDVLTTRDGADLVTQLSSGDGEHAHRTARVNRSFGPNTPISALLEEAAGAMRVGLGNAADAFREGGFEGLGRMLTGGSVLSGSASEELTGLTRSAGLEWSIQNGRLQILQRGRALAGTAVRLTSDTGLLGTPTIDNKGVVKATILMMPDVFPGRKVQIEGENLRGIYRVERALYNGDTFGSDWSIELECKAPQ